MNKNRILKLLVISTVFFIAACGNKGDLFLPETASDEAEKVEETNN